MEASVVALGNFDGVHRGHREVLSLLRTEASRYGLQPAVLVLWPHPRAILTPEKAPSLLTTLQERADLLQAQGVTGLYALGFDEEMSHVSPQEFVKEILVRHLAPKAVVVGENHRFGHLAQGSPQELGEMGKAEGFQTIVCPPLVDGGHVVSATRIRKRLGEGKPEEAGSLLGRPYSMAGTVAEGAKRGRTLGFPTANVMTDPDKTKPLFGVYAVRAKMGNGGLYRGVANYGPRPTVDQEVLLEVHLFDFEGDLYGQPMDVRFESFLRAQRRFEGLDELAAQIRRDADEAHRRLR